VNYPVRISTIVPVYNGECYIEAAIKSIIAQTYPAEEIIVIDDGSTDGSGAIVESFGPRVIYDFQSHTGVSAALNKGVALAKHDCFAFLDADDLWAENKLELQIAAINQSNVDMVFGHLQQFISPELDEKDKSILFCPEEPEPGYSRDTLLVKKEIFFKVGLFSVNYQAGEFIDWYLRAKYLGLKSFMLPNVVAKRRLHKTNMTGQDTEIKKDYIRVLKAGLDQRRSESPPAEPVASGSPP
jgi:glycosyltransferase involved in cell wall biosynthesis